MKKSIHSSEEKKAIIQKIAEAGKKCFECRRKEHIGGIIEQMLNIVTIQIADIAKKIAIMPCLLSLYDKLVIDMDDAKLAKTKLGNDDKPIRKEAAAIFGVRTVQLLRRLIEINYRVSPTTMLWLLANDVPSQAKKRLMAPPTLIAARAKFY